LSIVKNLEIRNLDFAKRYRCEVCMKELSRGSLYDIMSARDSISLRDARADGNSPVGLFHMI
jgi:hypothetical protein